MRNLSYFVNVIRRESLMVIYRGRTNAPYLSGDVFASIVDHAAFGPDGRSKLDLRKAGRAQSLFVVADKLEELLENCTKYSWTPSVLITGNSDRNFTHLPEGLPPSLRLWLCQNSAISGVYLSEQDGTKIEIKTLPIGLENISLARAGRPKWFRNQLEYKDPRVLIPPMSMTNPKRQNLRSKFDKLAGHIDYRDEYLPINEYMKLARSYKFVVCIEGNGFENHRIWETLYHGAFPILVSTQWSRSLVYLGFPILLVDALEELDYEELQKHAQKHEGFAPADLDILWVNYWRELVCTYEES